MTAPEREPQPGDPGYAAWYAQHHRILCAHADQDGRPAHWLDPGEKCPGASLERLVAETRPDDLPDEALPAAADWLRDVAAELEAKARAETQREAGQ